MNDGVVLYNGRNSGYQANIVIKGDDGVIRRYAVHGSTENLRPGERIRQGQKIGTVAQGHIHYEEIPPTINGRPNPVYGEFETNAGRNTFTSTAHQRGTVDPSGPSGSLSRVGKPTSTAAAPTPAPATAAADDRGGGTFAAIDMHKVRTTLDSSHAAKVRQEEEASGKLKAEVVAPPGTKVTVEGKGAFTKTEMTRRFTGNAARIVHPRAAESEKQASVTPFA
jgi:hypothetical protein